jgi:AcrR family transcriptional regulator
MAEARDELLARIIAEVAAGGLADRSLREIAEAVGSSHRMVLYHFGSREGLVTAIDDPAELVRALWARTSAPEMMPFVRLFFECVALTGGEGLTDPWLGTSSDIAGRLGLPPDEDELRLGVAVTRGLLIDVLATGDSGPATRSLERFLEMWEARRRGAARSPT